MYFRCALAALFLVSTMAQAQPRDCSISGIVEDPSAAVFAKLEVLLTGPNGVKDSTRTDDKGVFCFATLAPAKYRVSITAPGFETWSMDGIQVEDGSAVSLETIRLELSSRRQIIQVTASTAPVRLRVSRRPGVITAEELADMPLQGRDLIDAVGLLAGATDLEPGRSGSSPQSMEGLHMLGARAGSQTFMVDGVSVTDSGLRRTTLVTPAVRSVGEVRVLTSTYAAEYGRSTGSTISLVTRSGTKQFHGSADWLNRHESYSANDYFNNRNGAARPRSRSHNAGYSVGGPVYIPGKFNTNRSKLFFFFAQDFQSQLLSYGTRTVRVPTELERAGNFSESYEVNGKPFVVYDPLAGQKPFPGGIIPEDRFHRAGSKILSLFPLPNFVEPLTGAPDAMELHLVGKRRVSAAHGNTPARLYGAQESTCLRAREPLGR